VKGVTKIKVSNFGALEHDPATVQNAKKFEELTGIKVELLAWAEPPIVAKTISIFAAKSPAVDVFCYDHPTTYMQMWQEDGSTRSMHLGRPGCLEALCPSHQERPDGSRRQDLRVHRQVKTMMLFYRPSIVSKAPSTWVELQETAKKVTTDKAWGFIFAAGGEMDSSILSGT